MIERLVDNAEIIDDSLILYGNTQPVLNILQMLIISDYEKSPSCRESEFVLYYKYYNIDN